MAKRWVNRPEGSTWGDFGEDDQLGRLNLITPDRVRAATAEAKAGKTFCLSLPLDYPGGNVLNPRRLPPRLFSSLRDGKQNFNYRFDQDNPNHTDVVNDDVVLMTLQYSSQWDSLSHVGSMFDADGDGKPEVVYYNGWRGGEHIVSAAENKDAKEPWAKFEGTQAKKLGVENMAEHCIQGRGVMIDLHAHFGREPTSVGYDALMRVLDKDKVEIQTGDLVCIHTGFADMLLEMNKQPDAHKVHNACAGLDGRDQKLLEWITKSNLAVLIGDNYAVETVPPKGGNGSHAMLPLHEHCLFKLGVNLGEIWHLTPLANWLRQQHRSRFLLTAPPLRLPGAVGSPANAIATV
jgi:hypothetical protein